MLNEEHNNQIDLKRKLEALTSLPELNFDKELAWSKLYTRVSKKHVNSGFRWYGAAAALLLFIIVAIPVLISRKNKPVKNTTETVSGAIHENNPRDSDEKKPVLLGINNPSEINQVKYALHKLRQTIPGIITDREVKQVKLTGTTLRDLAKTTEIISLQPLNPIIQTAACVPNKKTLSVVYINELNDPVQNGPAEGRNINEHSIQLEFGNQEVYVRAGNAAFRRATPGILKISSN
jgi:hypothetical protein